MEELKSGSLQVVNFSTRDFKASIDINHLLKVISMPQLSQAPSAPEYVIGVLNLAGMIIDVIDLSLLLKVSSPKKYTLKTPILVCRNNDGYYFGLIVDEVEDIATVTKDMIQSEIGKFNKKIVSGAIKYKNHISLIINVNNLLDDNIDLSLKKSGKAHE